MRARVRSVLLRYASAEALGAAFPADRDTILDVEDAVGEGEWVLASFHLDDGRQIAVAARAAAPTATASRLCFAARDASRVRDFAAGLSLPDERITVPPRSERVSHPPPSGVGARVLLVDDDDELTIVMRSLLESVGLLVTTASSGEDAIELLGRQAFDLLVIDWRLPSMSGIELCRRVRAGTRSSRAPIVFVSGNDSPRDMMEAFASGADDYVLKPFRAPELSARIFSLLRHPARASMPPTSS